MTTNAYLIDKARVRASFDHAAARYDTIAVLQREVRERMLARLDYLKIAPRNILDAGCGTGHATRALALRYRGSRVVALDIAMGMLRVSRARQPWRWLGRTQPVVCGDLECLPLAAASMDMVWSNLTLQWCNDLDATFAGVLRVLRQGGLFMFSTFGPDTLKELRKASLIDARYTHVSRFIDMHDIGDVLMRTGFHAPVLDVEYFVLTYSEVVDIMRDLKAIGAHNATQGRQRGLTGKGFLRGLAECYEQFRRNGRLPATFEVIYGHAWTVGNAKLRKPEDAVPITMHRRSRS